MTCCSSKDCCQILIVHHILRSGAELLVALDDLADRIQKVLLGYRLSPRSNGKHPCFGAHTSKLSSGGVGTQTCHQFESDISIAIHALRVNSKNVPASLQIGQPEFDFSIQSSWTQQRWIQSVRSVGSHENLDITTRVKSIQLSHNLKHRSLNFVVGAILVCSSTCSTDRVDLIKEHNACPLRSCHGKQLSDHSRSLSNIFLDKFTTNNTDEASICSVSHSTGTQGFTGSGRSIQEYSLWWVNS
mmetsp:Transcript_24326/g.41316  ORF Transcript_24326/g.41316 Transcript_24326/m.41316 type:complete len:244 (+) Transcript_24326:463-1194(+)